MNIEVGIDITSIERIKKILEKFGITFLYKFLLPNEILIAYKQPTINNSLHNKESNCKNKIPTHFPLNTKKCYFTKQNKKTYIREYKQLLKNIEENFCLNDFNKNTIASFWAIKEACSKALGVGIGKSLSFHDICIFKNINGKPFVALNKKKFKYFKVKKISISVTHDCNMVIATCAITFK